MNIYKRHHMTLSLVKLLIALFVVACAICYEIGYHRGSSYATQRTSDELLTACEIAIEKAENSCVD